MKKYLILFLLSVQVLWSQVQFEARVSKNTLGANERLRIDFIMNFDGDNFSPPRFEGFTVIAGPSQQVSQSWINGRSSFEKVYSYYLVPNQKGIATIKPATIEYNGQFYKTNPVKISVTKAIPQPQDPNDMQQNPNSNLVLVAEISKTNPYLNEPITVVYKLYFNNIGITNFKESNKPTYKDFWSQNIEIKQLVADEGLFKGQPYRFVVLKKVVLYPQKSGKLEIEPLALDVDVQLPTNQRDIFGDVIITEGTKRVTAGAKTIAVKPLPEAGKPIDFTGAVGKFDFKVKPSKTSLKNGESLDLVVSITGNGNLKLFSLPKPVVPNALEMYDPVHTEEVNTTLSGMAGTISDKYTLVPQYKGDYPIKPLTFSYFDTRSGTYKTVQSPEIKIHVLDGPMPETPSVVSTGANGNKITPEKFKDIVLKTQLVSSNKKEFLGSSSFYMLLFLPFLLIPILVWAKKKKEAMDADVSGNRIRLNNRLAKKYLSQAKKQMGNKVLFYEALERALHNFLKAKLNIETAEMSKVNMQQLLLNKNANTDAVTQFIDLIENCEIARFAPSSSQTILEDYEKGVWLITTLEKQIEH